MEHRKILKDFFSQKAVIASLLCLALIVIPVIFAPVLAPNDIYQQDITNDFASPSAEFPLGTDQLGRCIFSRILYGGRATLGYSLVTVVLSSLIGMAIGVISGYLGGRVDGVVMRICDVLYAFPSMVLTLVFIAVAGRGMDKIVFALLITQWVTFARMSRTLTISEKNHSYISAARICGASRLKIMFGHIFPAIVPPMIALITINFGHTVLSISGLSFLGLGVQMPAPEWGAMINTGRELIYSHPMVMLWPGILILVVVVSLNVVGDYLQESLQRAKS